MHKRLVLVGACLGLLATTLAWWWAIRAPGGAVSPRARAALQPAAASTELGQPEDVPADEVQRDAIVAATGAEPIPRPPAAEFDDSEAATLLIQVRADATAEPVQGVRIVLWPVPKPMAFSVVDGETSSERFGRSPLSDERGRARIEVPAGRRFRLNAHSDVAGKAKLEIPALAVGERREVEVRLSMAADLRFVARVVDDESGAPLVDARVRVGPIQELGTQSSGEEVGRTGSTRVDQDGYFELELESRKREIARVEAPGYAWTPVVPSDGHGTRARAREVRLRRSAVVEARVVARGPMALEGIRVELSTESHNLSELATLGQVVFSSEPVRWSALTDAYGRCRIEGLPPGVVLDLIAHPRGASSVRFPGQPALDPGETRAVEIGLGGGAGVAGWLRDAGGAAVEGAEIWLLSRSAVGGGCPRAHERKSAEVAHTDPDGRFRFEQVPDGEWLVACAPNGPFAPETAVVLVADGRSDREPSLTADGSLYIRGRVLGPGNRPVETHVFGAAAGSGCVASDNSAADGTFSLGPLVRGSYTLRAMPRGEADGIPLTLSEPVQAEAGASGVILTLQRGGVISGRVVDPLTGLGVVADVVTAACGIPGDKGGWWKATTSKDGTFRFEGLEVGTYGLAASTTGLRVAQHIGVELGAGQEIADLVLALEPGARLRIHYDGATPYGHVRIYRDGFPVDFEGIERGSDDTFVVPAGALTVECYEIAGTSRSSRTQSVEVAAGELATVEFGRED